MQPQEKELNYEIPCIPCEVVYADAFIINNKTLLCIVDYYSKFPVETKVISLSAGDLVQMTKLIFVEYMFRKKTVSEVGTNFTLDIQNMFADR